MIHDAVRPDAERRLPCPRGPDLLVVVRAHDDAVFDRRSALDDAAQSDHGALDICVADDAAVADVRLPHGRAVDLAARQETHVRIDGRGRIEETERRHRIREREIRLEECADGADILPVALKNVRLHAVLSERLGDDVLAEIHVLVCERLAQRLAVENVDAHRGLVEFILGRAAEFLQQRGRDAQAVEHGGILRLFHEARDRALGIRVHDSKFRRVLPPHGDRRDGQLGLFLDVLLEHPPVIHPVELVAAEDDEVIKRPVQKIREVLPHRVRRALVPARITRRLLRREDLHEAARELVELVSRADVPVQRDAIELREHVDAPHAGVQAVRDRDVHEPVFSRERDGGLRSLLREREEPRARASAHDDRERFFRYGRPVEGVVNSHAGILCRTRGAMEAGKMGWAIARCCNRTAVPRGTCATWPP